MVGYGVQPFTKMISLCYSSLKPTTFHRKNIKHQTVYGHIYLFSYKIYFLIQKEPAFLLTLINGSRLWWRSTALLFCFIYGSQEIQTAQQSHSNSDLTQVPFLIKIYNDFCSFVCYIPNR